MNDYISREVLERRLCYNGACAFLPENGRSCKKGQRWCKICNTVDKVPAADVRPVVKSKWEDETGYIFSQLAQRVYCPVCKSYAYFYPITTKNYCPNCGADMREATNG